MEGLVETFHLDIKLLVAQSINFLVVLAVLYFFALKPLLGVMTTRTATIEKSLEDSRKIEEKLEQAEKDYNQRLVEAKKEASRLMEETESRAEERKQEIIDTAKEEIGKTINAEKEKMAEEKAKVLKEIRKEMGDLVTVSLEKILEEKMDSEKDKKLIKKVLKEVNQS